MQLFKKMLLVISICCCLSVSTAYAETEKTDASSDATDTKDTADTKDTTSVDIQTPASVTGEVIQGQGTVIDFSTTGSKAFYTIRDQEQKIFHLIIDLQKTENNVYFLSDVNKSQLEGSVEPIENVQNAPVAPIEPEKEEQPKESGGSSSFLIMILIVSVAVVVVYYFRMNKKKKEQGNAADEDEMTEDYEEEDVLYEDDDNKDHKDDK